MNADGHVVTRKAQYARKALVVASALALTAVGLLAALPVANAEPNCEQWGFAGEAVIVEPVDYDNGQRQYYRGGVHGDDGVATGKTSNGITNESGKQFTSRLTCLDPA